MRTMIRSVLVSVLLGGLSASAAQLPPDILADSYLLRAEQAVRDGEYTRAQGEINKLLDLQKEHELDLPDEFHFRYAKAAASTDWPEQALEAVVKYLAAAGREGQHYVEALELMNKAQDAIEGGNGPRGVSNEPTPPAQEASQIPSADQLGTGGTPEGQMEKRAPITADGPTEAQSARECDLWKWNTEDYFKTMALDEVTACLVAGADPKARDEDQETPLHLAAKYNEKPAVLQALLAAGADLEARDENQNTPLHWAAWNNENPAVVQALIAAGANPKARDKYKGTPLHDAARSNDNPAVVQALIAAGADPNARDMYKNTPLHDAAEDNENPAVLQALLAAGADLEARDENQNTPLHWAAWNNENPAVVQALIAAGADPNARNKYKSTPLHDAAEDNENPAVVQALIAAGADPNARNKYKSTPLDKAKDAGNITAIEVLRHQKRAAARKTRTKKRGGGWGAFIAGTALAITASAAGASTEDAVALGGSVITGQQRAGNSGPAGSTGGTAGGGSCLIPGYPSPPGGMANLGFSWCPASVTMQVRAFALQAAGAQCAVATGSSSTSEQIQARRREIKEACGRLAALGAPNCQCPPGLRP